MSASSQEVQAVIFNNKKWDTTSARQYLQDIGLTPIKRVDKTVNYLRYRITNPKQYDRFYMKNMPNGVKYVIGVFDD